VRWRNIRRQLRDSRGVVENPARRRRDTGMSAFADGDAAGHSRRDLRSRAQRATL